GFTVTPDMLTQMAKDVGETTIMSRTGGAPTLAVGMASILSDFIGGKLMAGIWYHFAILFEALFILTTVVIGSAVACLLWGYFLYQGVIDPLGGIWDAVATVRHRQSDAGSDCVDAVHRRAVQDEARAIRLGHHRADGLAGAVHGDRGGREGVPQ